MNKNNAFFVRNEVDRFGFSYLLSNILYGGGKVKKARCSWIHGWKWYELNDYKLLGLKSLDMRKKTIVVTNHLQYELLKTYNFSNVFIGGLPFAYALNIKNIDYNINLPKERDILVILPKAQYYMPSRTSFGEMISFVSDSLNLKNRALFCVFPSDLLREECFSLLIKSQIPYISGAQIDDPLALLRIRKIFSSFKYAITNTIGSHIPYLCSLGVDLKVCGPFDNKRASYFSNDDNLKKLGDNQLDFLERVHGEAYFKRKYNFLFDGNFNSDNYIKWGLSEIGYSNLLNKESLPRILGWDAFGLARASYQTASRFAYKFINV
jgi:hypothetical protein